jgi:mRNA interferase YafQ
LTPVRTISVTTRYRRDVKRLRKRGHDVERLTELAEIIRVHGAPPRRCRSHKLSGDWAGYMECHVAPDWLLVYRVDRQEVLLYRTGSHSDLFG